MQTIVIEDENAITICDPNSETETRRLLEAQKAHEFNAFAYNLTDNATQRQRIMELFHAQQAAHAWLEKEIARGNSQSSKSDWSNASRAKLAADEALAAATDGALNDMGVNRESSSATSAEGNLKHVGKDPWTLVKKCRQQRYPDTTDWPAPQPAHLDDRQRREKEAELIAAQCREEQQRRAGLITRE